MAATKRSLADTEAEADVTTKKQKVKDLAVSGDVDSDEAAELKKQKKKEKKERKKEKKDKKSKSAAAADQDGEAPPAAEAKAETEEEKAERKRQKKEKKEKKRKEKEAAAQNRNDSSAASDVPVVTACGPTPTAAVLGGYQQAAALTALPQSEVDAFLTAENITVTDPVDNSTALRPILEFSYLPETDLIKKKPFSAYKKPTPIQSASWPYTLSRRDVIGVAETGSGKTMAFALPLVEGISKIKKRCIKAVVVSPTRELAMQTQEQMEHVSSLLGLKSICIYGGASKDDQRGLLRRGADVIVATPGRLKDFMMDGTISLQDVKFAVLDEADRMLDKGFEEDIKMILGDMPAREARQTVMFTATWPASVRKLAESFMVDPVKITIGSSGKETANGAVELQANTRITQRVEVVDPRAKEQRLLQLLKQWQATASQKNDRILVFCLYKKEATRVEAFLQQRGIRVGGIHGDLRQEQRTRSLEAFKAGTTPVLVATDVAARGLDIPEVKLVINVTFPLTIEDYVHRIGRTGRAGKTGEAITLFTEHDKAHSGSLINILKGAKQPVPDELFKFGTTVKKKAHSTYGAFFKDVDMTKKATKITFD